MIATALGDISRDFEVDDYTAQIIFSTYFLGLAIEPFMAAAFSEITGRKERYNQTVLISALHYIAIAIGAIAASQIGGRIMDWLYRRLSNKNNNHGRPEFRVPYSMGGAVLMPIGLFWYDRVAEVTGPSGLVDIGASVFTLGNIVFSQGLLAYQLDEFGKYGASANAASRVGSNVMEFILPNFGSQPYDNLGVGWDNLLRFIWIVSGGPVCFGLYYWGERIRLIGKETVDSSSQRN
ncbi:hypothetical protein BOTCAL_0127g00150 [Botryotinia calthae]|uniref:Major facilitator superfamily (MFS) profile domain-containing protein n=1 Tax=Botryotinia calthae TaxID=38488 RepID=A0A4Y8D440_9HELO|nr:hypothetical protein BOTCAL_0127g00150 [Botryotinia calthae]